VWRSLETAIMTMRNFSDDFLDGYLEAGGAALCHSAGAYQIEALGIQLFERIEGSHHAILGMPLLPLLAELRMRKVIAA
jgi:septum formation protein